MVQVGMTGKNIGFPKAHGKLSGVGMKLGTGFAGWEETLEDTAVFMGFPKAVQDLSVLIQNLDRKVDTLVKGFQQLMKCLLLNNGI